MENIKLGKIITVRKGKKHELTTDISQHSVRFIQIDDLRNDNNLKYTNDKNGVLANLNDLLIAWDGANAGTVGFGKIGFIGSTIALLRINEPDKYDCVFLGYLLKNNHQFLRNTSTGATIPHINRSALESIKVPNLTIQDQQKIAYILSKAEALIQKRKETISLLDEFSKSTFLDMFGDPVKNPKGWEKEKLRSFFSSEPQNGLYKHGSEYGEGIKILRIDSFYDGMIKDLNTLKRVKLKSDEVEKYSLNPNDIVINRVNSREYLGKVGLIPLIKEKIVFESNMMRFSVQESLINPVFLIHLLTTSYVKRQILKFAKDAANQSSINQQDVKNIEIIIPPNNLQNQFAKIVEKVENLKKKHEESLKEIENLYQSLLQRAFKGELELDTLFNIQIKLLKPNIFEKAKQDAIKDKFDPPNIGYIGERVSMMVSESIKVHSIEKIDNENSKVIGIINDDIQKYFTSLPSIKSKDWKLIKKIRDLDAQKKRIGKIDFDEDYAIYRVLYPKFKNRKSIPFTAIFDYLHDFKDMKYDIAKAFIMSELAKKDSRFEQVYNEEMTRVELKLKL